MTTADLETRALSSVLQISIAAPRAVVWRVLTEEVDGWWLPDFRMVGAGSTVTLEARAGGQLLEARPDGASLLWYTVAMCTPGESLQLVGHLCPPFGGPATSMLALALEERDGASLLTVTDSLVGHVSESTASCQLEGWQALFGGGLKPHAEARAAS